MAERTRKDPAYLLRDYFSKEIAEERARFDPKSRPSPPQLAASAPLTPLPSSRPRLWTRSAAVKEIYAAVCILLLAILPFLAPTGPSNAALIMAKSVEDGRPEALLSRLGEVFAGSANRYRASLEEFTGTTTFNRFH